MKPSTRRLTGVQAFELQIPLPLEWNKSRQSNGQETEVGGKKSVLY